MSQYRDAYNNSFALVIGINSYSDPQFAPLGKAEEDARRFADLIMAAPFGFDVTTLLGKDATREAIETALFQLRATMPDDRILVYFAGHGYTLVDEFSQETGYLAAADTVPQKDYTALDLDSVTGLTRHAKAKHIAFIFDACFSGQALGLTRASSDVSAGKFLERRAFQVISAGAGDQTVSDARSMTGVLIDALGQGIADEDGLVTLSEIGLYLQRTISADSGQTQIPQFGHLRGSQGGEFVFYQDTSLRLPNEIVAALASSREGIREGGVEALLPIAHGDDADLAKLAKARLDEIAASDPSPRVKAAALGLQTGIPDTGETVRHDPSAPRPVAAGVTPPPPPGPHKTAVNPRVSAQPQAGRRLFGLPMVAVWGVAGALALLVVGVVCLAAAMLRGPGHPTPTPAANDGTAQANATDQATAPPDEQAAIKALLFNALKLAYSLKQSTLRNVNYDGLEQAYTGAALKERQNAVDLAKQQGCYWDVHLVQPDNISYDYIGEIAARISADRVEARNHFCNGALDIKNSFTADKYNITFFMDLINGRWLMYNDVVIDQKDS